MQPDSLAALPDSAATVAVVSGFLKGSFPWLSDAIVSWASRALGSVPIVAAVFAWELVGKFVRNASPAINEMIGKRLERFSWIINPLLGAILGNAFGDASLGLAAGGVWGMLNAALKRTPAAAVKARAVALALALGLMASAGMPGVAMADAPAPPKRTAAVEAWQAWVSKALPQLAVGAAWSHSIDRESVGQARPAYVAQIGFPVLGDHLHARARLIFKPEAGEWSRGAEYSVWWVF